MLPMLAANSGEGAGCIRETRRAQTPIASVRTAATTKDRMEADIHDCTVKPSHDAIDAHMETHQEM